MFTKLLWSRGSGADPAVVWWLLEHFVVGGQGATNMAERRGI